MGPSLYHMLYSEINGRFLAAQVRPDWRDPARYLAFQVTRFNQHHSFYHSASILWDDEGKHYMKVTYIAKWVAACQDHRGSPSTIRLYNMHTPILHNALERCKWNSCKGTSILLNMPHSTTCREWVLVWTSHGNIMDGPHDSWWNRQRWNSSLWSTMNSFVSNRHINIYLQLWWLIHEDHSNHNFQYLSGYVMPVRHQRSNNHRDVQAADYRENMSSDLESTTPQTQLHGC